eukprot:CAMPEP_0167804028 /NCGR_PEP_ID=MMETSP0111_2-20121227/20220_1 /TAXON_ID=91324 /ORGANISM="Lotharella globosa, Strain CCCM811" /LENGTH=146 /DNA_ID=CAMNT_0007700675 /DNA_START=280 /DNA_END=720 /DNA_ORIENTATION=+
MALWAADSIGGADDRPAGDDALGNRMLAVVTRDSRKIRLLAAVGALAQGKLALNIVGHASCESPLADLLDGILVEVALLRQVLVRGRNVGHQKLRLVDVAIFVFEHLRDIDEAVEEDKGHLTLALLTTSLARMVERHVHRNKVAVS